MTVLFALGYLLAIVVICRWLMVVREHRVVWLAVHHVGLAAIIAGWLIKGRWMAVMINSSWLVGSTVWFLSGWIPAPFQKENR